MEVNQIARLEDRLSTFLEEFEDCFVRSEPREHLATYVAGQVSRLDRKSVEPMALNAGTPPRTLQRFLESMRWDHMRLRDRLQWIVVRDHLDGGGVGIVDESAYPKCGKHTACVERQWCGHRGKVDNCVVAVHLSIAVKDFHCLLDSDLYMPKLWANDPVRREAAHIPEDVVFRTKPQIALDQIQCSLNNGVRVVAWTFDEFYGRGSEFLDGVQAMGQNFVGEVPVDFVGWLHEPQILLRPTPQEARKPGRRRRFPRLARKTLPASEVRNLATYSPVIRGQPWEQFHIKDGEKGPIVWEIKHAVFYRKLHSGLPSQPHYLIVARNVTNRDEMKYFVSNMIPGIGGVTLELILRVAFSRFPIEECFRQAKNELGMDHFEVRGWDAIHRHLYVSQASHLFCARVQQDLRKKKPSTPNTSPSNWFVTPCAQPSRRADSPLSRN